MFTSRRSFCAGRASCGLLLRAAYAHAWRHVVQLNLVFVIHLRFVLQDDPTSAERLWHMGASGVIDGLVPCWW